jgi:lipopolysaccharide/colanic/teichoic acid biosynthesis glycosyltransferase
MPTRTPVSRSFFSIRISAYDGLCAFVTPVLALWIRGAPALSIDEWRNALVYCGISFGFAMTAFIAFRVRDGVGNVFSVNDALEIVKAVAISELVTCLVLFSATRLDNIPRTTPVIHALLLSAALIVGRSYGRMRHSAPDGPSPHKAGRPEHIIVIGANKLSALYIGFLRAYAPDAFRVIALLDDRQDLTGRSLAGVRVLGPINHILPIVEEFKEHGISTDRILVGGRADVLTADALGHLRSVCNSLELQLDYIPELLGINVHGTQPVQENTPLSSVVSVAYPPPRYHRIKRGLDLVASLTLLIVLLPVFVIVAGIVLIDVGLPIFFWQQRIGRNGRNFQLHKFRTLKPSFDWHGRPRPENERLTSLGRMLRLVRLDELPQLLNVLVGDMSLIGPRPLLPRDQPSNPEERLSVRPGITGWAQVHGGTLLTPDEKNVLDEWYVRNASLAVDLKIVVKTLLILLTGERQALRGSPTAHREPDLRARRSSLGGT